MTTKISGVDELVDSAGSPLNLGGGLTIETRDWEVLGIFTAAAAASIDSSFWAADLYSEIQVTLENIEVANDAVDVLMRVSTDGSTFDSGASDYRFNLHTFPSNSGNEIEVEGNGNTNVQLTTSQGNAAGEEASGKVTWLSADDASSLSYMIGNVSYITGSNRFANVLDGGFRTAAGAVRGIQVLASTGNITGSFTVRGRRLNPTQNAVFLKDKLFHVRDEKAANTQGGTFTQDAWQTRVLNTETTNEITGASLASNQITLPAGTYYIEAFAWAFQVNRHKTRLRNITDGADIIIGTSGFARSTAGDSFQFYSEVNGEFTLTGTKVIEFQHRCQNTNADDGFGVASNIDSKVEVYAEVRIWKREDQAVEAVVGTLHVVDEKTVNTAGGTFTQGAVRTRTLNTVRTNTITGAALATDQITLPPGTYECDAWGIARNCDQHRIKLRDTTGSVDLLIGVTLSVATASNVQQAAPVRGRFTLSVESVIELQHECTITGSFGIAANLTLAEVYADVIIRQLST